MGERPQGDPPTDSLTTLGEAERGAALRRFEVLRPHLQDGVALTEAATAANVPVRSLQRWVARYRKSGLASLARQQRSDAGRRRLPPALVGAIEGLALCTPRFTAAAIHRRLRTLVGAQRKHQNPWGQSSRHRRLERPNADPERLYGFQTEDGFAV